jgi:hypothetical protein
VDTRRLALLLALSRLGSMRRVADAIALTTSIWRSPTTTTWHPPPPTPFSKRLHCGPLRGVWVFGPIPLRTLAALAGITPHIAHQIDSLDLVEDLILDGYRVGLLPVNRPTRDGIAILRLMDPSATLTAYAVTRRGRSTWSPQRAILDRLRPQSPSLPQEDWPRPAAHPSAPDVNEP